SRRRHTRFSRDWSSDVCSSDLRSVPYHFIKPLYTTVQMIFTVVPGQCISFFSNRKLPLCNTVAVAPYNSSEIGNCRIFIIFQPRSEERRVGKASYTSEQLETCK